MLLFPNCKINIGLNIISKRLDGFHDLETIFYPVKKMVDVLEAIPQFADNDGQLIGQPILLSQTGLAIAGAASNPQTLSGFLCPAPGVAFSWNSMLSH